jgi:hypothetical protein
MESTDMKATAAALAATLRALLAEDSRPLEEKVEVLVQLVAMAGRTRAAGDLLPRDYQQALDAQSASNLSGLVLSLAEVMPRLNHEMRRRGVDAGWRDRHPIVRLYLEQLEFLAGPLTPESWARAAAFCRQHAAAPPLEPDPNQPPPKQEDN